MSINFAFKYKNKRFIVDFTDRIGEKIINFIYVSKQTIIIIGVNYYLTMEDILVEDHKLKTKASNTKLVGGVIVGAAIVAVAGIGVVALNGKNTTTMKKLKGTPEEIIMAAYSNTNAKALEEQDVIQEKSGAKNRASIEDKEASRMNFEFGIQGISGVEYASIINAYIKDISLSGTFDSTKTLDKMNGEIKVAQSGMELLGLSMYKNDKEIGTSIPGILDAPYAVKLDTLMEDYQNSALYKLTDGMQMDEEQMNELTELVEAYSQYLEGCSGLASNEVFLDEYNATTAEFVKNAEIKENGVENVILSDGKEVEWKVYSGTLTGEEFMEFIDKEIDLIMNLEFARNYFEVAAKQADTTVEEMLEEIKADLVVDTDVTVDVDLFVDENYFRGINVGINEENERTCNLKLEYKGNEYLMEAMTMSLDANDGIESVGMVLDFSQKLGEENLFNQCLNLTLSENGESLGTITYNYNYDTKAKENNLDVSLDMDFGYGTVIKYTGVGTKIVSEEEVSTNLSSASLYIEAEGETITLDFNLGYGIKEIKASDIVLEDTGAKYILEMSEEELMAALQTIQSNIQAISYGLF